MGCLPASAVGCVWSGSNLNGLWDYAIRPKDDARPEQFDGKILVPFAVESALSGVMKAVGPDQRLWYHRTFTMPDSARVNAWLLNFQAVDWHAQVWVNGQQVGEHQGGYDPFTFDITARCGPAATRKCRSACGIPPTAALNRGASKCSNRAVSGTPL